jgi:exopolysaccharide biosynthesis polyprenyl glycosylphosphotransferase
MGSGAGMLREHYESFRALLLPIDVSICAAVFQVCVVLPATWGSGMLLQDVGTLDFSVLFVVASLGWPIAFRALGGDSAVRLKTLGTVLGHMAAAALVSVVVLAATAFLLRARVSPSLLVVCAGGQLAALSLVRGSLILGLRVLRRKGRNYRNVLIVGTGPRARAVCETIERHPEWGLRIVGFADEGDTPVDPIIPSDMVYKLVDMPQLLRDQVIDEVVAACPRGMLAQIGPVVAACSKTGVPLTVLTDLFGDYLPPPRVERFASHAALSFAPVHHSRGSLVMKRAVDLLGASLGLALTAPVIGLAALAIRLSSPGPILFRQIRCGVNGRRFEMLKLRTMTADAEQRRAELEYLNEMDGPVFKMRNDPRITPVGRWLRRLSIDELPQLWNVLRGDMSLVGPRPPIPAEVAQYEDTERRRLSMRPGLTCLWQVSGRNEIGFEEWVKMDLDYIDTWSLGLDFRILLLTIPAVLTGSGE